METSHPTNRILAEFVNKEQRNLDGISIDPRPNPQPRLRIPPKPGADALKPFTESVGWRRDWANEQREAAGERGGEEGGHGERTSGAPEVWRRNMEKLRRLQQRGGEREEGGGVGVGEEVEVMGDEGMYKKVSRRGEADRLDGGGKVRRAGIRK